MVILIAAMNSVDGPLLPKVDCATARAAGGLESSPKSVLLGADTEEESNVTTTKTSIPTTAPTAIETDPGSGITTHHQLKCSVTLEKLPKRVRLALTKGKRRTTTTTTTTTKSAVVVANGTEKHDLLVFLCQFCDHRFADKDEFLLHQEQDHLTANLGRRASGRSSSIHSFPGCSLCNVTADNKLFASHSNDLDALFAHLIDKHSDRYFACAPCNERYTDAESLAEHSQTVHGAKEGSAVGANTSPVDPSDRKVTRQSNSNGSQPAADVPAPAAASLSRMAQAQNRFPLRGPARAIKGRLAANSQKANESRNVRGNKLGRSMSVSSTGSNTNNTSSTSTPPPLAQGLASGFSKSSSNLPSSNLFDENFYETITCTVRRNLSQWVDGKIEDKSRGKSTANTTTAKEEATPQEPLLTTHFPPVGLPAETEIHAATSLAAVTAFPTLLTAEQYGLEGQAGGKIRRMFTKNSWKWKFDFVKKYKYVNEGGKVVKKAKEQNLGQRDLSKLDMWTQLTMRTKHETTKRLGQDSDETELDVSTGSTSTGVGESVRAEKRRQVNQLDTILDSRLLPQIGQEQHEQRLIKQEAAEEELVAVEEEEETKNAFAANMGLTAKLEDSGCTNEFPLGLQLIRKPNPMQQKPSLTLSGEWARPRCYVCFGCGAKFETVKSMQDHKAADHPNTQTTHYEMVGRELIEGDLHHHLYIPKEAIGQGNEHAKAGRVAGEREKPQRGRRTAGAIISKLADDALVPCSKCKKDCDGRFELYRHMLDCVGDYAWLMAKKRLKYRYYGNRSRRRKSNARSIFGYVRPQKKSVLKKDRLDRIKRRIMRSGRHGPKPSDGE